MAGHTFRKIISRWWQSKNKASIFFDGASKGNPGKAGVGGLIFYPGIKLETSFSWGIVKTTNNQAELFALLKACQLAKEAGHNNLQIFGYSGIIIKTLNSDSMLNSLILNVIMQSVHFIWFIVIQLTLITFFAIWTNWQISKPIKDVFFLLEC